MRDMALSLAVLMVQGRHQACGTLAGAGALSMVVVNPDSSILVPCCSMAGA